MSTSFLFLSENKFQLFTHNTRIKTTCAKLIACVNKSSRLKTYHGRKNRHIHKWICPKLVRAQNIGVEMHIRQFWIDIYRCINCIVLLFSGHYTKSIFPKKKKESVLHFRQNIRYWNFYYNHSAIQDVQTKLYFSPRFSRWSTKCSYNI